jgi:hypothetical protein
MRKINICPTKLIFEQIHLFRLVLYENRKNRTLNIKDYSSKNDARIINLFSIQSYSIATLNLQYVFSQPILKNIHFKANESAI